MKVENHTTNLTEIKRIIREYYKQLYTNRLDSIDKMKKKFPETQELSKLTQEEIENWSRSTMDGIFVYSQNSFGEILAPNVILLGGGNFW